MAEKMRFIRKNGRIIPIGPKSKEKRRSALNKADFAAGAAGSGLGLAFHKRIKPKSVRKFAIATGLATTAMRAATEDNFKDFVKQDVYGGISKFAGGIAGAAGAMALLAGGNKLAKLKKLRKTRR